MRSLRREALLHARYPGLKVEPLRGNLDTRLRKLDAGQYDAIILAAAGLIRDGIHESLAASGYKTLAEFDTPDWAPPKGVVA